jgi:hypothetical protein
LNNRSQKLSSLLTRLFQSKAGNVPETSLADFRRFGVWQKVCEDILAKPFPPQDSDFPQEILERDSHLTFAEVSNWEIICQEILDTEHSHIYSQRCYDALLKRGKSEQEILEMRRFAWQIAGWFNYPMIAWDWISMDESDIQRAIDWLYDYNEITREQRMEFEAFLKRHAR